VGWQRPLGDSRRLGNLKRLDRLKNPFFLWFLPRQDVSKLLSQEIYFFNDTSSALSGEGADFLQNMQAN
jgi:hypothetical protein